MRIGVTRNRQFMLFADRTLANAHNAADAETEPALKAVPFANKVVPTRPE